MVAVVPDPQLFILGHAVWHAGSQLPNQGSTPCPLHWEPGVFSTGLPGSPILENWRQKPFCIVLHLPVHELEISLHFSGSLISAIRVLWFSFLQILYVYIVCLCVYLVLYLTTFQGSISVNGGVSNFKFLLFTVGILKSSRLWYINIIWYNLDLLAY